MSVLDGIKSAIGHLLRPVHAGEDKIAFNDPRLACDRKLDGRSDDFVMGGPLPSRQSHDGGDVSPAIHWDATPKSARELVLLCEDPDAPLPSPFVHWLVYGIAPTTAELPRRRSRRRAVPRARAPLMQGKNRNRRPTAYTGAAPPHGHGTHRYHFQLFALDAPLGLDAGATRDQDRRRDDRPRHREGRADRYLRARLTAPLRKPARYRSVMR